jgi:hypothetical protein
LLTSRSELNQKESGLRRPLSIETISGKLLRRFGGAGSGLLAFLAALVMGLLVGLFRRLFCGLRSCGLGCGAGWSSGLSHC